MSNQVYRTNRDFIWDPICGSFAQADGLFQGVECTGCALEWFAQGDFRRVTSNIYICPIGKRWNSNGKMASQFLSPSDTWAGLDRFRGIIPENAQTLGCGAVTEDVRSELHPSDGLSAPVCNTCNMFTAVLMPELRTSDRDIITPNRETVFG